MSKPLQHGLQTRPEVSNTSFKHQEEPYNHSELGLLNHFNDSFQPNLEMWIRFEFWVNEYSTWEFQLKILNISKVDQISSILILKHKFKLTYPNLSRSNRRYTNVFLQFIARQRDPQKFKPQMQPKQVQNELTKPHHPRPLNLVQTIMPKNWIRTWLNIEFMESATKLPCQ